MTSLVLVRHGRTEANALGLLLGRLDVPLDGEGERQARAVAAAVAASDERITTVVSSPLLRTRQTASAFGLPVVTDERFIEMDYGDLDGTPIADVSAETWRAWRSDPGFSPPGGETLGAVGERVAAACADWATRTEGGSVVIVTHVSPLKAAVAWALGVGDATGWRTHVDPASISRVGVGAPVPVLRSFNETGHLRELRPSG